MAFEAIKGKLYSTFTLDLPNFELLFEIECNASGVRIGVVLTQAECPMTFLNEKLNGSGLNHFTYDREFHVIIRALEQLESLHQAQALRAPFRPQGIVLHQWSTKIEHKTCQVG